MLHNVMNSVSQRENTMADPSMMDGSCYEGFTPYPTPHSNFGAARRGYSSTHSGTTSPLSAPSMGFVVGGGAPQATLTAAHQSILNQLFQVNSSNPVYAPSLPTPYPLFVDVHTGAPMRLSDMTPPRGTSARSVQHQPQHYSATTMMADSDVAIPDQYRYTPPQRPRAESFASSMTAHSTTEGNSPLSSYALSASAAAWLPPQPTLTVGTRRVPYSLPHSPYANTTTATTTPMMQQYAEATSHTVRPAEPQQQAKEPEPVTPLQKAVPQPQPEPATVAKPAVAVSSKPTTTETPARVTKPRPAETTAAIAEEVNVTPVRRTQPQQQQSTNSKTTNQPSKAESAVTPSTVTPARPMHHHHHQSQTLGPYIYELRGRCRVVTATGPTPYAEGTAVIFDGDRGIDIAYVRTCNKNTHRHPHQLHHHANNTYPMRPIPVVQRTATEEELAQWEELRAEELEALEECQRFVGLHGLDFDMSIVNAAYQFDKQKLTFFYQSACSRVDFRKILNDLFTKFRCRIWMERDETDQ